MSNVISFTLNDIAAVLALIAAFGTVITLLVKAITWAKKPSVHQDERLDSIDKDIVNINARLDKHDEFFHNDKIVIDELKRTNRLIIESLFALLQHGIDGNNTKQMEEANRKLQEYLIFK